MEPPRLVEGYNSFFVNLIHNDNNTGNVASFGYSNSNLVFLDPTGESEVSSIFKSLSNSSSCDADELQVIPVKYVIDIVSPILTCIL